LINKLVFENLRHRPLRTLLSVIAIGIEVTMMLTLVGLSRGMLDDFKNRTQGGGADILLRAPGASVISFSAAGLSQRMVDLVRQQPHVALATGTLVHPLSGVSSMTGINLDEFSRMSGGFKYVSGGPFQQPNDIIVDEFYARQQNKKVGDILDNILDRKWRICGIVEPGKLSRMFVPIDLLQDLTSNTGKLTVIYIKADTKSNIPLIIDNLKTKLNPNMPADGRGGYQVMSMEEFASLISVNSVPGLQPFIYVIVALSVVVGFLVVSLTMYTAVLERTREIGILKALGASPGFIISILIRETTLLAIIGSVVGIVFSFGTKWLIQTFVPAQLLQAIVPDWWPIASAVAVSGALLGALYPGTRAARQDAIEALSYE
jgi:putative ABC transport system permease protein